MSEDIKYATMEVVEGEPYTEPKKKWWDDTVTRTDYVRFRWSTGFLIMRKYDFDKNKQQRKLILDTILGKEKKSSKKKVKR